MNMGVSQILHMYIINLIIMAFNIIIMKNQNMLKMNNMKKHVNINKELEIVTKTMRVHLYVSKRGGPPTKLPLKVMHPNSPL